MDKKENGRLNRLIEADNEIPYKELITVRYKAEELEELENILKACEEDSLKMDFVFSRLDGIYRFECVRKTDRTAYVMFQGEDGSLLCAFFDKEKYYIYQVEHFRKFYSVKDFERIRPGITTKDEIEEWFGELGTHCSRMSSVHLFNRVAEEGTCLIYFQMAGLRWMENPPVWKTVFLPDGEKVGEGFKRVPMMLPMDKRIVRG